MAEPNINTSYQDDYQSPASTSDERQLTLIGLSTDGPMDSFMSFVGMAGLESAELLFGTTGRLARAIREAIDASVQRENPITVNVMRGGEGADKAGADLKSGASATLLALNHAYKGTDGNDWWYKVEHSGGNMVVSVRYGATGTATQFTGATIAALVTAIGASSLSLEAEEDAAGDLADIGWTQFTGGLDGTMTNAEVIRLLSLATAEDYPNIMVLGATSDSAVAAIKSHCASMLTDYQNERYAFIEGPSFDSTNDEGSAAYLVDLDTWKDTVVAGADALVDERNLITFAGQAVFLDSSGTEYTSPVSVAAAASWLGNPINRSMINIQVPTVQSLYPAIPPAARTELVTARVNYIRYQTGRGYIIGNSNTLAASTSDFNDAEILRAIYVCGAEARVAGTPVWGKPNDPNINDGLESLESAMSKPLETRKGLTIVDYEFDMTITSGVVAAKMGVQCYDTMKIINHMVYRKRS